MRPENFGSGFVTGHYIGLEGDPIAGTVVFKPMPTLLIDAATKQVIVPTSITATLVDGKFNIELPASNDPDVNPSGWTYQVTETFTGGRTYNIEVKEGTTVDITAVSPVPGTTGTPVSRGQRGSVWYVSSHPYEDHVSVPDPMESDLFLYRNSWDLFRYDGSAWAYMGTLLQPVP